MDELRIYLYISRMEHVATAPSAAPWTFQLLSMPLSVHTAREQFSDAPQWSGDLHLIHTLEGSGILHMEHQSFAARPSNVLVVPVFSRCRWEKHGGAAWRMLNLHARIFEADGTPVHEQSILPTSFAPPRLRHVHRRLTAWHQDWTNNGLQGRVAAAAGVLSLIGQYLEQFGRPLVLSKPGDPQMQRLRERLQAQASGRFDAAALAGNAALSISQCNRRFRASFGVSPKLYWQRHRLTLAQTMLSSTPDRVGQIAEALGFPDIYYFSRWFSLQAGLSPTAFRRQHRAT
jgi:AraC-like DNA-binding protein